MPPKSKLISPGTRPDFLTHAQPDLLEESFQEEQEASASQPVECLGVTYANDVARRNHYLKLLSQKLEDPEFRKIEGFPLGNNADILALSDPPYYTACPNPWMADFVKYYGNSATDGATYRCEPFAADVSEGKTDPIYTAHSYHTKVPHRAIMRYILHYTKPGDLVFDGFCGTGMTGVAAQLCADADTVRSLGYQVQPDGTILDGEIDKDGKKTWVPFSTLGARRAILNDLSTAATFIAYNYNAPFKGSAFETEAKRLMKEFEDDFGWMYQTHHGSGDSIGKINYTVWSEIFSCPHCAGEIVYHDEAVNSETFEVQESFPCPHCAAILVKKGLTRTWDSYFDTARQTTHKLVRYKPVLISYEYEETRYEKKPDAFDLEVLKRIDDTEIAPWFPICEMLDGERRSKDGYHLKGISHLHHFYFRRALIAMGSLWSKLEEHSIPFVKFFLQGSNLGFTKMNRYQPVQFGRSGGSQVNRYFSGTLFVGSLISEVSPKYSMTNKLKRLSKLSMPGVRGQTLVTCQSTTNIQALPSDSLDYIFIDPPFGNNLHYSELNFFWESWLKVLTRREPEAVMDKGRKRTLHHYQVLMASAFRELHRVLKPSRWITIEFHNSSNNVWMAIQDGLEQAGFVVADVRTLDKQQETYKQSIQKLVKQDLVISAYKPANELAQRFKLESGTEEGVWDFVRNHLRQLPVFVAKDGEAEVIVERLNYLLFDRMVAFHIRRGVMVPMSANDFYAGLDQKFSCRDGMYFITEQSLEYDRKRLTTSKLRQMNLFVSDEATAIQWLRQLLKEKPQSAADLNPQFMQQLSSYNKNEQMLELTTLLEQNFLVYSGIGPVPDQIHSYLSTNWKELRNLDKESPALMAKANGRWFVPDPNKALDLEKVRERDLLRDFDTYRSSRDRKITKFRVEALRAGFRKAWQDKDYQTIIAVAAKIPETAIQEDPKLLMWHSNALTRAGID